MEHAQLMPAAVVRAEVSSGAGARYHVADGQPLNSGGTSFGVEWLASK